MKVLLLGFRATLLTRFLSKIFVSIYDDVTGYAHSNGVQYNISKYKTVGENTKRKPWIKIRTFKGKN